MDKLKVGVVGIGHLGKEHARIYSELENVDLVGLADIDPAKAAKAKELGIPFYQDSRELLPQIQAVSIAVPTSAHYEVAKEFLARGVHTLVEKPMASSVEEADALIELAVKHRCAFQVGHVERFNPAFRALENVLGRLRFIEIHRLGPFTPRVSDCGVVLDLMIHDIDILLGLIDSEVENLDAVGVNVLTGFEDIANVRLRFRNGCVADLTASRLTPERQRKIRIFQDDAYISLDYGSQSAQIYRKQDGAITREELDIKKEESLRSELAEFVDSARTGRGWGKPDTQARHALELALRVVDGIREYQNTFLRQPFLA